jgi:hypothetical protein
MTMHIDMNGITTIGLPQPNAARTEDQRGVDGTNILVALLTALTPTVFLRSVVSLPHTDPLDTAPQTSTSQLWRGNLLLSGAWEL